MLAIAAAVVIAIARDEGGEPVVRPATLADYWAGSARWELAAKWTDVDPSGAHMEIVGNHWYLFDRGHTSGTCPDGELRSGVQVRESTDRGATWSAPVMVIAPAADTPWSCAATDGDAVYDRGVWRYLFQCKADGGGWNGCYAERRAASPMGPFSGEGVENPVIRSGQLWGQICDAGDDCGGQPVHDEGTFNVFDRGDGSYWVSFHGFNGARGYRGIARTVDFRRFVVDRPDEGVPGDAFLDERDADDFNESWADGRSIGAGAGGIVAEGGYFYALNEFPDMSLRCTDGQNWDLGLFRSASLASTTWAPFPGGNPIVYSSRAPDANGQPRGCNVLYPSLFRDPATGTWYLMHGRGSSDPAYNGIYVYRLVHDANLLVNGDFATADARGWTLPPGAVVNRLPNGSPDGTQYLSFGCEANPCQSVSQDVPVDSGAAGRAVSFGGTFRADSGSGSVRLAVLQLDGSRRVVDEDAVDVTAGAAYAESRGAATVRPETRFLRYALTPGPGQALSADNLFVVLRP